ncbi:winged helix-turn-helix domain-containing protein [Actinomadura sp. DC4]|uniref:winged helix-turn-helix domain-containing protein n=1 Tax=Actinomadura sp. DC4 TaxID=3055069 RepID=UPI0025B23AA9|nr:winged helix-turn-helix domain-containing protein [Actinomadura sp. DC4]MDN3354603.1 winged helix-turn-helix domain-containing protein [Actinomadura sp. DC4]
MTSATEQDATELHIGRLGDATVRVSLDPYLSVLALTTDALGGRRRGAPESWRKHIRAAVSPAHAQAVWPLVAPGHSVMPDSVSPLSPVLETSVDDQVERLRGLSPDDLLADLDVVFGSGPPRHWRAVARQPGQWLRAYAGAMSQVWAAIRPAWRDARPLLDREVARVGAAAVRGRLDVVLGGIHPNGRFEDGVLKIRDPEPARFDLAGRPLVLVPMISGGDALICCLDRPDAVWLGYPVPGVGRLFRGAPTPPHDNELELLLGPVRAQLLSVLTRPTTMGELATLTSLTPSAITYHCERLGAAGLVRRERHGREVRVSLTPRAEQLTELFGR